MAYHKPWQSYGIQLERLAARGMQITDRALALDYLERIGYYRLSGYWFAFRQRSAQDGVPHLSPKTSSKIKVSTLALEQFKPGASFQNAVDLYVFDKQLRLLTMDALERIEISLRVDISHTLGALDAFAYLRSELFHDDFSGKLDKHSGVTRHHHWLGKHAQLINRSKEESILHNKEKYGLPLAIWIACEVRDFGTLSTLYDGMRVTEQDAISGQYGIRNGRVFASWLRSLSYLRNVCAHHSRLWNRNIVDQPKLPAASECAWIIPFEADAHARARCFLLLSLVRHLLQTLNPRSSWPARMKSQLQAFPDLTHLNLSLAGMGIHSDWQARW